MRPTTPLSSDEEAVLELTGKLAEAGVRLRLGSFRLKQARSEAFRLWRALTDSARREALVSLSGRSIVRANPFLAELIPVLIVQCSSSDPSVQREPSEQAPSTAEDMAAPAREPLRDSRAVLEFIFRLWGW